VDCGTPCTVSDLATETKEDNNTYANSNKPTSPPTSPNSNPQTENNTQTENNRVSLGMDLLTCSLCTKLCRRGVVTTCCRARSCRGCGVKYVTQKRKCWGQGCGKSGLKTGDLKNDLLLREAVEVFNKTGEVCQDLLIKLQNAKTEEEEEDIEVISDNVGEELAKMIVSPVTEIIIENVEDDVKVLDGTCDSSSQVCDMKVDDVIVSEGSSVEMIVDKGGGKMGNKRDVEENIKPVSKRSKFDQICSTVGFVSLFSQFSNTVLVKLSLIEHCELVKIVFSKDFLKYLRSNNCILSEKCINQKCKVLLNKGHYYTFIHISFKHVKSSSYDLKKDFHIANFSKLGDKKKTEPEISINISIDTMTLVDQNPKVCKVFLSSPKNKNLKKEQVMESVFYITECFNDKIEILSAIFKPSMSYRLGSDSKDSNITAQILIKSRNNNKITLTPKQLIAEAMTCLNETDIEQVLSLHDCFDDGIEIINGTEVVKDKNWFAALDISTRQKLAEGKKLEGNSLFSKRKFRHALKKYSDAIELDESEPTYFSNRAACYISMEDPAHALTDALRSVELDPSFAKGWLRAAKCCIMFGDIVKAKEICDKVTDLSSNLSTLVEAEIQKINQIEKLNEEFLNSNQRGHFSNALHHLDQIAEICPKFEKNHLLRSELLALKGEFEKCNTILSENFDESNNCADVLYIKALVLYYQDNFDLAFTMLNSILKLDPNHQKSKNCMTLATSIKDKKEEGNSQFKDGKYDEAFKLYTEALEIDKFNIKTNAKLYFNRATVYVKLGKLSEAIDDCTKAIQLDKTYQKPYLRRANAYMEIESFDQAVKDFEQLVKMDMVNKEYKDLLTEAIEKLRLSKNKDFYKLLGVDKKANQEEIKKSYRKAALTHHPDRHSVAEEHVKLFHLKKFKDIGEAYGILSDETKRSLYDQGILYQSIQAENGSGDPATAARMAHTAAFWASMGAAAQVRMAAQAAQQQAQMTAARAAAAQASMSSTRAGLAGARPGFIFLPRMRGGQSQRMPFQFAGIPPMGGIPPYGLPSRFQNFSNYRF